MPAKEAFQSPSKPVRAAGTVRRMHWAFHRAPQTAVTSPQSADWETCRPTLREHPAIRACPCCTQSRTERPVAPPSVTITYLSKCHKNALGLPVVNPEDFVQFCNENDVAAVLTVGRHVPENYSQPDMRALLSTGEYISEEGPLQVGSEPDNSGPLSQPLAREQ